MKSRAALIALVAYIVVLGLLVLWPTHPEAFLQPQLTALIEGAAAHPLTAWVSYPVMNVVANILLFTPLTLLATLAFGRRWWFLIFAIGAVLAASAELAQLLFLPGRVADISDVVAGSIGSLLGAMIGFLTLTASNRTGKKRHRSTEQASDGASGENA